MSLNKEKMIKWAEALESGQYEQCRGSFGQGDLAKAKASYSINPIDPKGFCCLHVAIDIEDMHAEDLTWSWLTEIYGIDKDQINLFMNMNDQQYLSFPFIAAEIRKMVAAESEA